MIQYKYIICLLSLIGFTACETVIDVELDIETQPVLNILLDEDVPFTAFLFESELYSDPRNSIEEIKNAEMTISVDGNEFSLPYNELSEDESYFLPVDGFYRNEMYPVQGKTYTLRANIEGRKEIQATTTFPIETIIEKVDTSEYFGKLDPFDIDEEADTHLRLEVSFNNIPNEKNFYAIKIRNKEGQNPYFVLPFFNNNSTQIPYYRGSRIFSDENLNVGNVALELWIDYKGLLYNYDSENPSLDLPDLEVVLLTLNKEMYNYVFSLNQQSNNLGYLEELFFEPVNVFTNVNNGLGIFAALSGDTLLVEF